MPLDTNRSQISLTLRLVGITTNVAVQRLTGSLVLLPTDVDPYDDGPAVEFVLSEMNLTPLLDPEFQWPSPEFRLFDGRVIGLVLYHRPLTSPRGPSSRGEEGSLRFSGIEGGLQGLAKYETTGDLCDFLAASKVLCTNHVDLSKRRITSFGFMDATNTLKNGVYQFSGSLKLARVRVFDDPVLDVTIEGACEIFAQGAVEPGIQVEVTQGFVVLKWDNINPSLAMHYRGSLGKESQWEVVPEKPTLDANNVLTLELPAHHTHSYFSLQTSASSSRSE